MSAVKVRVVPLSVSKEKTDAPAERKFTAVHRLQAPPQPRGVHFATVTANALRKAKSAERKFAGRPSSAARHEGQQAGKPLPMLATVGPVSFWLMLLVAIPLIYVLALSVLTRSASGGVVAEFSLSSYAELLNADYMRIYGVSLLVALLTTVVCVLLAYPFAAFMAAGDNRRKLLMMVLVIVPFWTNSLIRLYGWKTLLGASGVVNSLLKATGLIEKPLELLFNTPAVVLGMVYTLIPFMILPVYASIEKLDRTLLEAASDLGARPWKAFFEITLPHTMPGIFAGSIMVFIPSLGYFFVSDLMGGGNFMLIGNLIKNQFYTARNWPLGAALSIVLIAVTLLLVKGYQKAGGDLDELGVA